MFGVLRLVIAAVFIGLLVWALTMMGQERTPDAEGYAWIYFIFGGLALLIGLPSLVIGLGLLYRRTWAYHAAIWHDFAFVLLIFYSVSQSPDRVRLLPALLMAVLPLAEVSILPLLITRSRPTSVMLPVLLVVAGSLAFLNPVMSRNQDYQQVRPVVDYAKAHWLDIPDVRRVETSDVNAASVSVFLWGPGSKAAVITAAKESGGRWRLPTRDVIGKSRPALIYESSAVARRAESPEGALAILRDAGVKNDDLVYAGTIMDESRLHYRFRSAKAGGSYYVPNIGTGFDLYLEGPDVVIEGG